MSALEVPKEVLDSFWKLSDAKENVRIDAGTRIVAHSKSPFPSSSFDYCLRRLVRGLASNRAAARQGFFAALVALLRQIPEDKVEAANNVVREARKIASDASSHGGSKSEEGEFLCGQLLCGGALLRWGRLDQEQTAEVVADVLRVAKKRSYLLTSGYQIVIDFVQRYVMSSKDFCAAVWPSIASSQDWKTPGLESLWLLVAVNRKFPKALRTKSFLKETLGREELVDADFLASLSKTLTATSVPLHLLSKHPALDLLLENIKETGLLSEFWEKHVCPLVSRQSTYRSMIGFFLLERILDLEGNGEATAKNKSKTLSRFLASNVIETAVAMLSRIESASTEEDAVIRSALAKLSTAASGNSSAQKSLLHALLSPRKGGSIAFDKITGTNVVGQIVKDADADAVKFVGGLYRDAVLGKTDGGELRTAHDRVYAAQQLGRLVCAHQMQEEAEWKTETLCFLLVATLFDVKEKAVKPLDVAPTKWSKEARQQLREVFFRALDFKAKNFGAVCEVLVGVLRYADAKLISKFHPLAGPMADDAVADWKKTVKSVESLSASEKKEDLVFQLLYAHMGLQLLIEPEMARETLAELRSCHERCSLKSAASGKKKGEEPRWVEVVVEVLLSLLSQNKNFLRNVVGSVFALLCPHVTTEALESIMEVVNPVAAAEVEDAKDGDEDGGSEDEWEDMDEDENKEDGDGDEEHESESEEDDDDDDNDAESDGEAEGKVSADFRDRVKAAIGDHAAGDDDEESIDMDDIPDEDMAKMDKALADVFKVLSKGKKSSEQKRKETKDALALTHFKIRALDLIDVYVSREPNAEHVLHVVDFALGALAVVDEKKEPALVTRLIGTLKKLTNRKKPANIDLAKFDESKLTEQLQALVQLANEGSPLVTRLSKPIPIFSQIAALLVKMSQQVKSPKLTSTVTEIYRQALDDFFNKKNCVLPVAFFQIPFMSNWAGSWALAEYLVERSFDTKTRHFRRTQGLSLIASLFHNLNLPDPSGDLKSRIAASLTDRVSADLRAYASSEGGSAGGDLKPRYICELLSVVHGLKISKVEGVDWEAMREALAAFKENVPKSRNFQEIKKAFNKVGVLLNLQVVKGSEKRERKRNDSECGSKSKGFFSDLVNGGGDGGGEAKEGKKKKKKGKKRKHNKEALEDKKERKMHALEGQFEGMEMPSFSGLALDGMNFKNEDGREAKSAEAADKKAKKGKRKAEDSEAAPKDGTGTTQVKKEKKRKKKN